MRKVLIAAALLLTACEQSTITEEEAIWARAHNLNAIAQRQCAYDGYTSPSCKRANDEWAKSFIVAVKKSSTKN